MQMGTPLALKVLDPHLAQKPDYLTRFKREASAAAQLRSSHVVQIFDFGIANNIPYIAMELLEGEDLGTRLDRIARLQPTEVSAVITQVARALSRAHKRQIIHRDLKPDNIFLCTAEEGESELVKVLDFGLAKGLTGENLGRTSTGIVVGTPYYMSPEQAQGDRTIDHRTDLWSLGVITYECMLGRRPFEATNLGDLLLKICTHPSPIPSKIDASVPDGFDEWFRRACAREPDDRYKSAHEMAATLALLCGRIPAGLSDSSYVSTELSTVPPDRRASDDRDVRIINAGEPTGRSVGKADAPRMGPASVPTPSLHSTGSHENDATQVMSQRPAEIFESSNIEIEIPIDIPSVENVIPMEAQRADTRLTPAQEKTDKKAFSQAVSTRPTPSQKPSKAPSEGLPNRLLAPTNSDDDAVQLFSAADVAASIAREVEIGKRQQARQKRRALFVQLKWPIIGGSLLLLAIVAAIFVFTSR
jgi:serine/threonine-protein kinase